VKELMENAYTYTLLSYIHTSGLQLACCKWTLLYFIKGIAKIRLFLCMSESTMFSHRTNDYD